MAEILKRPKWGFEIPEHLVRWIKRNGVQQIQHKRKHDGFGIVSEEWLVLVSEDAFGKEVSTREAPLGLFETNHVSLKPDYAGLVQLSDSILANIKLIDDFVEEGKKEAAKLKRMKAAFSNLTPEQQEAFLGSVDEDTANG